MTTPVKGLVLLSLLNIPVVDPKVPSSFKTTIHETFTFWYHITISTYRDQPAFYNCEDIVTFWHTLVCGICSWSIIANRISWAAWKTSPACSTFRSPVITDHTCDSPNIRKIFQLHYGTMNQGTSQQTCLNDPWQTEFPSACSPTMWP
jgi:hypothetical protein